METAIDEKLNLKVDEFLEKTDLYWSVEKCQLKDEKNRQTESYGLFRQDTGKWLGTVGGGYEVFQNWEMAATMISAAHELGIDDVRGGHLREGQLVYAQLPLPDVRIGNSEVRRLMSLLNSFASRALAFGSSGTVIVCYNTYNRAYAEIPKFRHTATLKERVKIAKDNMIISRKADDQLMKTFNKMADTPIKNEIIESVMNKVLEVNLKEEKKITDQKMKKIQGFLESIDTSIKEQGANLWAVFNGVTRYTNHVIAPTDEKAKQLYLLTGTGAELSNRGFNEIMRFMEENSEKAKSFAV